MGFLDELHAGLDESASRSYVKINYADSRVAKTC